jgi:hypothetical protein
VQVRFVLAVFVQGLGDHSSYNSAISSRFSQILVEQDFVRPRRSWWRGVRNRWTESTVLAAQAVEPVSLICGA